MGLKTKLWAAALVVMVSACQESEESGASVDLGAGPDLSVEDSADMGSGVSPDMGAVAPDMAVAQVGRCEYTNPFSRGQECKEYTGAGWTAASAEADCGAVFANTAGTFEAGARCGYASELGRCVVGEAEGEGYLLINEGADPGQCGLAQTGCESFAMGSFTPGEICASGDLCEAPVVDDGSAPFVQPYLDCRDPLPGEPAGQGPGGQVCTHVLVSACTEPGRRYDDYASCDDVITQRGYRPNDIPPVEAPEDPRLQDADYMAELDWVKSEVEACACVCCHSSRVKPEGASAWDIEAGALWIDTVPDTGLAMMAGLADSASFGAYPPEENNGFDRSAVGTPTTDVARMRAFLTAEFTGRGFTEAQGREVPPFGGPLYTQSVFTPEPCEGEVGVDAEGVIRWSGGGARYLYVLAEGAANPGVYPNLIRPEGTLWQIEVPDTEAPFGCGMRYSEIPEGARQMVPAEGEAPALVSGETYYLVALKDLVQPLARCTFVYEGP